MKSIIAVDHPSGMTFDAWSEQVRRCAETMTRKLINFREVEFAWADRYADDEPLAAVIDALVSAGMKQVVDAVGQASGQTLAVYALETD